MIPFGSVFVLCLFLAALQTCEAARYRNVEMEQIQKRQLGEKYFLYCSLVRRSVDLFEVLQLLKLIDSLRANFDSDVNVSRML